MNTQDALRRVQESEQEAKEALRETQEALQESLETVQELQRPPPEVPGADRQELLRLLDRRQHELTSLSEEWRSLASRLEVTSAEKSKFQTRCVCMCALYYVK